MRNCLPSQGDSYAESHVRAEEGIAQRRRSHPGRLTMAQQTIVIDPSDYLAEVDVEGRWPVLKAGEIRRARKAGVIEFFAFATGPRYTPDAVQDYIDRKYRRKPTWPANQPQQPQSPPETPAQSAGSSAATTSTSPIPIAVESTTPAGMTPELAQSAAEACAQRLAKRRSKHSSPSSRQPRHGRLTSALTLVKS
ncbi:hypothetical protein [Bosea sp. NPDC055594]